MNKKLLPFENTGLDFYDDIDKSVYIELGTLTNENEKIPIIYKDIPLNSFRSVFQNNKSYHDILLMSYNASLHVIRNLFRKENHSELLESFVNGEITNEEYEDSIKQNPDKYEIKIRPLENVEDLKVINKVVYDIGDKVKDLSVMDVSELFAVNPNDLYTSIRLINK